VIAAAAVLATLLPAAAGSVAAWAAFVLTIPFMTTLLPFTVGIGLLRQSSRAGAATAGSAPHPAELAPVPARSPATRRR
jgi:hypothetical protein